MMLLLLPATWLVVELTTHRVTVAVDSIVDSTWRRSSRATPQSDVAAVRPVHAVAATSSRRRSRGIVEADAITAVERDAPAASSRAQ
jgi:hypothetical protein